MNDGTIIGMDTAKSSFVLHGADVSGVTLFRKTCRRAQLLPFLRKQPRCTVALESCAGAHNWGREIQALGHEVKLIPPIYVKPFVKRQKNDANDAAAVVEAASRASMRTVAVKSREMQAKATLFRCRALLIRQRTQTTNSIRGLLLEFGLTAPRGLAQMNGLREQLTDPEGEVPEQVGSALEPLFLQLERLSEDIKRYDAQIETEVQASTEAKRFMTIPGIGPITAFALLALVGDMKQFRNGREFAAWLGLTPREHSSGGRHQLGGITKMGQRDLRSLLVQGALALYRFRDRHWSLQSEGARNLILTKHPKVVAVAWANRAARIAWAVHHHQQDYDPAYRGSQLQEKPPIREAQAA